MWPTKISYLTLCLPSRALGYKWERQWCSVCHLSKFGPCFENVRNPLKMFHHYHYHRIQVYQWLWIGHDHSQAKFLFQDKFLWFWKANHRPLWNTNGPLSVEKNWKLMKKAKKKWKWWHIPHGLFYDQAEHWLHLIFQHQFHPKSRFEDKETYHYKTYLNRYIYWITVSNPAKIQCLLPRFAPKTSDHWIPRMMIKTCNREDIFVHLESSKQTAITFYPLCTNCQIPRITGFRRMIKTR